MRTVSEAEQEQLYETFAALCAIPSPTGDERACADWVTAELRNLGVEVEEDGGPAGWQTGNLLARVPGASPTAGWIMLCVHLDTVPPLAPLEPELRDGYWANAHPGILGADNKAAVAVAIELARRLRSAPTGVGLELLFTVAEETGLQGAAAFDVSRLRSPFGYCLDHATPIGEVIMASPTYHRIRAEFLGRAAHAGIRPEDGHSAIRAASLAVSAMELGRIDEDTTSNVGLIQGGSAANVVPERCFLEAEVRSLRDDRAEAVVSGLVDCLQDGAGAGCCDVDVTLDRIFSSYRQRPRDRMVTLAEGALAACGHTPRQIRSGGGSDANALIANGFPCLNLANGTERAHQPDERVSQGALTDMLEVMVRLLHDAAPPRPLDA